MFKTLYTYLFLFRKYQWKYRGLQIRQDISHMPYRFEKFFLTRVMKINKMKKVILQLQYELNKNEKSISGKIVRWKYIFNSFFEITASFTYVLNLITLKCQIKKKYIILHCSMSPFTLNINDGTSTDKLGLYICAVPPNCCF